MTADSIVIWEYKMNQTAKDTLKRILTICVAATLMATNIKTFVRTGELFPGGATGLTVLVQRAAEMYFNVAIPYTIVNLILNAIPIYIGFRYIGKKFTAYSCLMIFLTNILTDLIPAYVITYDTLLISVFGGIINGFVISLCLRVNTSTGGTDFLSIYMSQKKGMDSFNMVLGINIVILSIAGLLFGWDKALYSIIFQFTSTQMLHTLYKKYQQQTLLVVTDKPREVCEEIYKISHHGATIIKAEGSYKRMERAMIYSVVSSAESKKVVARVKEIDPQAFVNVMKTEQLYGRFYQAPNE